MATTEKKAEANGAADIGDIPVFLRRTPERKEDGSHLDVSLSNIPPTPRVLRPTKETSDMQPQPKVRPRFKKPAKASKKASPVRKPKLSAKERKDIEKKAQPKPKPAAKPKLELVKPGKSPAQLGAEAAKADDKARAKKKAAPKKANGSRHTLDDAMKIKIVKQREVRDGTNAAKELDAMRDGRTVGEYVKALGDRAWALRALSWHRNKGFITVS